MAPLVFRFVLALICLRFVLPLHLAVRLQALLQVPPPIGFAIATYSATCYSVRAVARALR
eukprot:11195364-Lingulodinium_polyedra.AAC.1